MPEEQTQETPQENENTTAEEQETKTLTQDDIDTIVEKRLARERAKYSDYDELKAAADRLSEIEDQQKSEVEKAAEKAAVAQKAADEATRETTKLRIALDRGLTGDKAKTFAKRLTGDTQEELEADADELIEFFAADESDGTEVPRQPKESLKPGASSQPDIDPNADLSPAARMRAAYAKTSKSK